MADATQPVARTPLDPLDIVIGGPSEAGVILTEIPFRTKLVLRGLAEDKKFLAAVKSALGVALPVTPNSVATSGDVRVLWTGPDEWMVTSEDADLAGKLAGAVKDLHAAVTEVTEHYTQIRLSGANARTVMAKGCAVDLHPRAFTAGQCAQTHIGRISVLFEQLDDGPSYEIFVRASFAEYLWKYLEDAGLEFGVRIEAA